MEEATSEHSLDARRRVLALEERRQKNGYKAGWLYYKCKDLGLLPTLDALKAEGLVGDAIVAQAVASVQAVPVVQTASVQAAGPRLTIELVPSTCWFSNVRSEVSREQWDFLKQQTYQRADHHCELCGGQGRRWQVECHELWHYNDETHRQTLTGLTALCPACHEVKHIGLAGIKGRGAAAARHLASVNGWSSRQADEYIAAQFDQWSRRSQFEWTLDVTWLEPFGIKISPSVRGLRSVIQ